MSWGGWSEFFSMGGFALYVWGAYAVTLALMITEIVLLALRRRDVLGRIRAHGAAAGNR